MPSDCTTKAPIVKDLSKTEQFILVKQGFVRKTCKTLITFYKTLLQNNLTKMNVKYYEF